MLQVGLVALLTLAAVLSTTLRSSPDLDEAAVGADVASEPSEVALVAAQQGSGTTRTSRLPAGTVLVAQAAGPEVAAYQRPDMGSELVATFSNPTSRGGPLVFQTVEPELALDRAWIEVYLPVRPNGTTGWVLADQVELSANPFRIEIDTERHLLKLFENDRLHLSASVGIGVGDTPTPIGDFYIVELLKPPSDDGPYGPYAFGLSGFSESLDSFAGGEGVIGIHGTNDPRSIGRDASHGCIRVANQTIEELASILPLGTPVHITD